MQPTINVHEAGVVHGGADLGAGVQHLAGFVGEHRRRDIRVLDREGAAKAAALLDLGKIDQLDAANFAQQAKRNVAKMQAAQGMAAGVIGHAMRIRSADIGRRQVC